MNTGGKIKFIQNEMLAHIDAMDIFEFILVVVPG